MCAVCSECSLNLVGGQVFVGACSVGFFSNLYYQSTNVASLLHYFALGTLVISVYKKYGALLFENVVQLNFSEKKIEALQLALQYGTIQDCSTNQVNMVHEDFFFEN